MINEKNELIQVNTDNYKEIIDQYSHLIGKVLKPENLPLLDLFGTDWSTHGETQNNWLLQKHGKPEDQTILTEEELKKEIEVIKNFEWNKQFIEIMGVFRKDGGQVLFHPLESILIQNPELV